MIKVISSGTGCRRLFFIPGSLNLGVLAYTPEHYSNIRCDSVEMLAGNGTDEGVVSIIDNSMSDMIFQTFDDFMNYLNGTFRTNHSLNGYFNISSTNYINYENMESFSSGVIGFEGDVIANLGIFKLVFNRKFV